MKLNSFTAIATALDDAEVKYLIAGGLAVNAHGYLRYTKDVDIVLQLIPDNIERAFSALKALGYRPIVPISAAQFADAQMRQSWVNEKNMMVLQFWSDAHIETPIDMFVSEPFPFETEYAQALEKKLHDSIIVRFVSMQTLLGMKQSAGRPQDLADVEQLKIRISDNG
jgi:hypothetical protein